MQIGEQLIICAVFENFLGDNILKLFVNICQKMLIGDENLRKEISLALFG